MAMQDEPLTQAQANLQRMSLSQQQALELLEAGDAEAHIQEAIRYGEQCRDLMEEILDSTDDERLILHTEQALDYLEEALDQANQALFASEASMGEYLENMGSYIQQTSTSLSQATEMEVS